MSNRRRHLFLSLAAFLAAGTSAGAADLYPVHRGLIQSAPELTPVEIGNGWYIRGDVSYDLESDLDGSINFYTPFDSASISRDELGLDNGFSGGVGFGYQFTDFLRADLTARYGKSDLDGRTDLSGACLAGLQCDASEEAELRTWDLMANAYVDLGTFAGITPYVGGGVGAVNVKYDNAGATYCDSGFVAAGFRDCETIGLESEDSWRFAYALSAGLAYNITHSLALDVGYRYLNVEGGDMYGLTLDDVGLPGSGISGEDDGFDRHTIQAGLRYKLW